MLRISKGKETLTLKGDHLETNFQGFYQKSLHWRPRSPMETSVHNPVFSVLTLASKVVHSHFDVTYVFVTQYLKNKIIVCFISTLTPKPHNTTNLISFDAICARFIDLIVNDGFFSDYIA